MNYEPFAIHPRPPRPFFYISDGRIAFDRRRARPHIGQVDLQALEGLPELRRTHSEELGVQPHDVLRVPVSVLVYVRVPLSQALGAILPHARLLTDERAVESCFLFGVSS